MNERHAMVIEIATEGGTVSPQNLDGQRFLIGRARDAHVYLESGTVSRRHAEIYCDPFHRWWVRDLGSRNGTRVNGVTCPEHVVQPGDVIGVGEFLLRVVSLDMGDATPSPGHASPAQVGGLAVSDMTAEISTLHEVESPRLAASHLSILNEFGQGLLRVADPQQRMIDLCRLMVRDEFQGRCALVMRLLREQATEAPQILCPAQAAPRWMGWSPYISRTLLRVLRRKPEPLLASNTSALNVSAEISLSPDVIRIATIACPLRTDDKGMDVLYVILPPEYGTGEWLALAALVARQFQQAESAWVARQQEAAHAAIERELEKARQIQQRLLPANVAIEHLDVSIGFKPCRWVGGDYADIVRFPDGRILLVVADVCGKGLPAALVAYSLHTTIRVGVRAGMALPDLMQHLNEYLCESLADQSFVTMVCALIDPATGRLECANAGHPPALVIDSSGQVREVHSAGTPPLGICSDQFSCELDSLKAGELLALYTDGLTDLQTGAAQYLGLEALTEHLCRIYRSDPTQPAGHLADELTGLLDQLQGDNLSNDDRTFLLARRT